MFFNAFLSEQLFVCRGSAGSPMIGGETCGVQQKEIFRRDLLESLVRNTNDAMINWSPVISSSWEIIRNFEHNSAHFEVRKVNWQRGDGWSEIIVAVAQINFRSRQNNFFRSSAFENSLLGKMVGASGYQLMFSRNHSAVEYSSPRVLLKVIPVGKERGWLGIPRKSKLESVLH